MVGGTLSSRLAARPRKTYPVDLAPALGLDEPAPAVVRIPRSGEDDSAIVAGFSYTEMATKGLGAEAGAAARADVDLLSDAKSKAALAAIFRDPEDPDKPLFPSADWLRDHLSTDEVAALANVAAEIRRVDARIPLPDDAGVEALLALLAGMAERGHAVPGVALAEYPREVVTFLLVEAAVKLREARRTAEAPT